MKQEKLINPEFDIPYYIFDEIVEYIEKTAQGRCKTMKWENIKSLLKCAVINERLTERQAEYIEESILERKKIKKSSLFFLPAMLL